MDSPHRIHYCLEKHILTGCSSDFLDGRGRQLLRSPEMCYANKDEVSERVWSLSPCPRHPSSNVDPSRAHPTQIGRASCREREYNPHRKRSEYKSKQAE